MNEHGYCPQCNADLDGASIWQTFYTSTESEEKADEYSSKYGATQEKGKWGRAIGVYDLTKDAVVSFRCPDCKHTWRRK